eukprot:1720737-Rhodomonas_salina.1
MPGTDQRMVLVQVEPWTLEVARVLWKDTYYGCCVVRAPVSCYTAATRCPRLTSCMCYQEPYPVLIFEFQLERASRTLSPLSAYAHAMRIPVLTERVPCCQALLRRHHGESHAIFASVMLCSGLIACAGTSLCSSSPSSGRPLRDFRY